MSSWSGEDRDDDLFGTLVIVTLFRVIRVVGLRRLLASPDGHPSGDDAVRAETWPLSRLRELRLAGSLRAWHNVGNTSPLPAGCAWLAGQFARASRQRPDVDLKVRLSPNRLRLTGAHRAAGPTAQFGRVALHHLPQRVDGRCRRHRRDLGRQHGRRHADEHGEPVGQVGPINQCA